MSAPDRDGARRQATATASLVERVAGRVGSIAKLDAGAPGFADLAVAADSLGRQARTAADAIDRCLALGSSCVDAGVSAPLAIAEYDLALKWTATLDKVLDAAVAIYGLACSQLADRVAVGEEHLPTAPSAQRLSAVILVEHARALTQCRSVASG